MTDCVIKHLALSNVQYNSVYTVWIMTTHTIKHSISLSTAAVAFISGVKVSGVGFGKAIGYLQAKPINAQP